MFNLNKKLKDLIKFSVFIIKVFYRVAFRRPNYKKFIKECFQIGYQSLPIVIFVAFFIGSNLAVQGYNAFKNFGGQSMVGLFVGLAGLREMAPIVAGAMVGAKAGSGMAASIASMKIRDQVDALEVLGVDPIWYLVVPRFLAIIITLPLLVIISNFCCVFAGYLVSVYQLDLGGAQYVESMTSFIGLYDIYVGMIKGLIFGVLIVIICTYFGFTTSPGPEGVGKATNKAVVAGCVFCIIANYFLTELFY